MRLVLYDVLSSTFYYSSSLSMNLQLSTTYPFYSSLFIDIVISSTFTLSLNFDIQIKLGFVRVLF